MKHCEMTPVRRLEGVAYWVIENPEGIYDFINREIRKEWETDARFEDRDLSVMRSISNKLLREQISSNRTDFCERQVDSRYHRAKMVVPGARS